MEQSATRRLRILKYRGSAHGGNEMPFLIDDHGVSVLPITSLGLAHQASSAHLSTGVAGLDAMFGKKGFFRGNSVLVSGTAGAGQMPHDFSHPGFPGRRVGRRLTFSPAAATAADS